jgi:hypothetical protein
MTVHMSKRRLLWALLLFLASRRVASAQGVGSVSGAVTPRLRVDIVFDGPPMPPKIEEAAMEEATRIWAAYGMEVHWCDARDVSGDNAVRLAVRLADRADRRTAKGALGSILFVDDVPTPSIVMYRSAIAAIVSTVRLNGSPDREWPTALYELMVGRVLGRALAHEIGHFLLQSRQHAAAGLMRAPQWASDLVSPDRRRFGLSADEVTRLMAIAAASRND